MTDTPKDEEPPPIVRVKRRSAEAELEAQAEAEAAEEYERWDAADKAKQLKALFSNRMFVQPDGQHLRISFGEKVGDETVYHTAMVVPNSEALEFGNLLVRMANASIEQQVAYYRQVFGQEGAADGQ